MGSSRRQGRRIIQRLDVRLRLGHQVYPEAVSPQLDLHFRILPKQKHVDRAEDREAWLQLFSEILWSLIRYVTRPAILSSRLYATWKSSFMPRRWNSASHNAALLELLRAIGDSGYSDKLVLAFTHFDQVSGPNRRGWRQHGRGVRATLCGRCQRR